MMRSCCSLRLQFWLSFCVLYYHQCCQGLNLPWNRGTGPLRIVGPDTSEEAFQKSSTELQSSTAEILQSAATLRESVEERQLSMAVTAKSFSPLELKKQVDEYQKAYDELWTEVHKLDALEKSVGSSMLLFENLMGKPETSQSEADTLQQNIDELRRKRTELSEKSTAAYRQTKRLKAEMDMLILLQQRDSDNKE
jgi:hypothetical protein